MSGGAFTPAALICVSATTFNDKSMWTQVNQNFVLLCLERLWSHVATHVFKSSCRLYQQLGCSLIVRWKLNFFTHNVELWRIRDVLVNGWTFLKLCVLERTTCVNAAWQWLLDTICLCPAWKFCPQKCWSCSGCLFRQFSPSCVFLLNRRSF